MFWIFLLFDKEYGICDCCGLFRVIFAKGKYHLCRECIKKERKNKEKKYK